MATKAKKKKQSIVVTIEGGVLAGACGIPDDIELVLRDYDVEGADLLDLHERGILRLDVNGYAFMESVVASDGEADPATVPQACPSCGGLVGVSIGCGEALCNSEGHIEGCAYYCTRPAGHEGPHVFCSRRQHESKNWTGGKALAAQPTPIEVLNELVQHLELEIARDATLGVRLRRLALEGRMVLDSIPV